MRVDDSRVSAAHTNGGVPGVSPCCCSHLSDSRYRWWMSKRSSAAKRSEEERRETDAGGGGGDKGMSAVVPARRQGVRKKATCGRLKVERLALGLFDGGRVGRAACVDGRLQRRLEPELVDRCRPAARCARPFAQHIRRGPQVGRGQCVPPDRFVAGSRATMVNAAAITGCQSRDGATAGVATPTGMRDSTWMQISIELVPTHETWPRMRRSWSARSSASSQMRSTDAVTIVSGRVDLSPSSQCWYAIVPASASRSSISRPILQDPPPYTNRTKERISRAGAEGTRHKARGVWSLTQGMGWGEVWRGGMGLGGKGHGHNAHATGHGTAGSRSC